MKIGELAKSVGIEASTIRYYEDVGLLPKAQRTASGYRQYSQAAAQRLVLIKLAKQFGFTLTQLADLLGPAHAHQGGDAKGDLDHARVLALLAQQESEINNTISALQQKRTTLNQLRQALSDTWQSGRCVDLADIETLLTSDS